jgi:hypothetical protein
MTRLSEWKFNEAEMFPEKPQHIFISFLACIFFQKNENFFGDDVYILHKFSGGKYACVYIGKSNQGGLCTENTDFAGP